MSVVGILSQARSRTRTVRMLETCTVVRTTAKTTNLDTGQVTNVLLTVYSGVCRVKLAQPAASNSQIAGGPQALEQPTLYLPHGSAPLLADDKVSVQSSLTDPVLIGRSYRIGGIPIASQTSAERYQLIEVTG